MYKLADISLFESIGCVPAGGYVGVFNKGNLLDYATPILRSKEGRPKKSAVGSIGVRERLGRFMKKEEGKEQPGIGVKKPSATTGKSEQPDIYSVSVDHLYGAPHEAMEYHLKGKDRGLDPYTIPVAEIPYSRPVSSGVPNPGDASEYMVAGAPKYQPHNPTWSEYKNAKEEDRYHGYHKPNLRSGTLKADELAAESDTYWKGIVTPFARMYSLLDSIDRGFGHKRYKDVEFLNRDKFSTAFGSYKQACEDLKAFKKNWKEYMQAGPFKKKSKEQP